MLDETYHPNWNETLTFFINPEDPCEVWGRTYWGTAKPKEMFFW